MGPRGKTQKENFNYFHDLMRQIEWDLHQVVLDAKRVPKEWNAIARARAPSVKTRITMRVEADVVKFFRKMGPGYQTRMNDVLAAWMHGRIAGLIRGADAMDVDTRVLAIMGRPRIGDGELWDRGLIRTGDGRIFDLDEERYLGEEEGTK